MRSRRPVVVVLASALGLVCAMALPSAASAKPLRAEVCSVTATAGDAGVCD